MKQVLAIALGVAATTMSGCIPKSDDPGSAGEAVPLPEPVGGCNAEPVQKYLGERFSTELEKKIKADAGASTVRSGVEGSPVTMDYNPARLNIFYRAGGVITVINCG